MGLEIRARPAVIGVASGGLHGPALPARCGNTIEALCHCMWRMKNSQNSRSTKGSNEKKTQLEKGANTFVALVGERLRKARERTGISRPVFARLSQVSLPNLAQLGAGSATISLPFRCRA